MRTATALLAACDAESRWGAAAGAAIDEAAASANRERVMSFAAAAASAAAMLLQRLQVCRLEVRAIHDNVAAGSTMCAVCMCHLHLSSSLLQKCSPTTH